LEPPIRPMTDEELFDKLWGNSAEQVNSNNNSNHSNNNNNNNNGDGVGYQDTLKSQLKTVLKALEP
jgi:hypothetical protein